MWKKPEQTVTLSAPVNSVTQTSKASPKKACIGPGLTLKGELSGNEDVIIEGRVEGKVTLKGHSVIIEKSGRVDADIFASNIRVSGEVHGNLHGTAQVVLLETGRLEGNILAKGVTIEPGAQFKGSVDMESVGGAPQATRHPHSSNEQKANGSAHTANTR